MSLNHDKKLQIMRELCEEMGVKFVNKSGSPQINGEKISAEMLKNIMFDTHFPEDIVVDYIGAQEDSKLSKYSTKLSLVAA